MIVMQDGGAARLGGRSDQQIGRRDPTMSATAGEKCLDLASPGDLTRAIRTAVEYIEHLGLDRHRDRSVDRVTTWPPGRPNRQE